MKNIAFSMTTEQMLEKTKDVTRRLGWLDLTPGTKLMAVEKGMGLKRGEKVKPIGEIFVVKVSREKLSDISIAEVVREGFPEMTVDEFITMFCKGHHCEPNVVVTRIEFEHLY